jgi:hypothetical protein
MRDERPEAKLECVSAPLGKRPPAAGEAVAFAFTFTQHAFARWWA